MFFVMTITNCGWVKRNFWKRKGRSDRAIDVIYYLLQYLLACLLHSIASFGRESFVMVDSGSASAAATGAGSSAVVTVLDEHDGGVVASSKKEKSSKKKKKRSSSASKLGMKRRAGSSSTERRKGRRRRGNFDFSLENISIETKLRWNRARTFIEGAYRRGEWMMLAGLALSVLVVFLLVLKLAFGIGIGSGGDAPLTSFQRSETSTRESVVMEHAAAEEHPNVNKKKLTKKPKAPLSVQTKRAAVHSTDVVVNAAKFYQKTSNIVSASARGKYSFLICPDAGGKDANKECSRGFMEYRFNIEKAGTYWLYVQTYCTNIYDNSLWVSPALDENGERVESAMASFESCDGKQKAGSLVPHKHVSRKKLLCCPAYLAKNLKKKMAPFYTNCCYDRIGPEGNEMGCVLDLEVGTAPTWNMLPRPYQLPMGQFSMRLYAREDGTAVMAAALSANPKLKSSDVAKRLPRA